MEKKPCLTGTVESLKSDINFYFVATFTDARRIATGTLDVARYVYVAPPASAGRPHSHRQAAGARAESSPRPVTGYDLRSRSRSNEHRLQAATSTAAAPSAAATSAAARFITSQRALEL